KLWVFEPDDHRPNDERPAIVFFFGGGWKGGNPGQFEHHCRYLASRGMVAMTADYRVRSRHDTLADRCVADAKSAVRWVRANADRLGIDPDRIVAGGGSAGGHIAACTGVVPGLDEPDEDTTISSVPNAMALFNPALVLAAFDGVSLDEEKLADLATRTGVAPQRISPIHHVEGKIPPTIIFHGKADSTVAFATAKAFSRVAIEKGGRCELKGYEGAQHGFFNYGRGGTPGEHYQQTIKELDEFLVSLGYLSNKTIDDVSHSPNAHLRGRFDNSRIQFERKKRGGVAFIGGSITEMNGYRPMVMEYLEERFPETEFTFTDAGISSTCSTTGAFRLQRDVLSADPDLLFVEFAVNDDQDAGHAARECLRGMEGVLRHARTHNPNMDIIVTHFVNPGMLDTLQRGGEPVSSSQHERVAAHYGVSSSYLAREVADRITAGKLTWEEYGGTHPKEPGNRLAADMVIDILEAAWKQSLPEDAEMTEHAIAEPLDSHSYTRGRFVPVNQASLGEGWEIRKPDWEALPGSKRDRFTDQTLLCSNEPGAEFSLDFEGTAVGAYILAGPDAGILEFSIDGSDFQSSDLFHHFSKGLHYPRTVMFAADLPDSSHQLTVRLRKEHNEESSGTAARILQFSVNG
ncbi:MAG: alpha/beta hydrolase fold domain-containing protein, partial [Pirellulaceae bacterium]